MVSRVATSTCEILSSTSTICIYDYVPEFYRLDFIFVSGLILFFLASLTWIHWSDYSSKK